MEPLNEGPLKHIQQKWYRADSCRDLKENIDKVSFLFGGSFLPPFITGGYITLFSVGIEATKKEGLSLGKFRISDIAGDSFEAYSASLFFRMNKLADDFYSLPDPNNFDDDLYHGAKLYYNAMLKKLHLVSADNYESLEGCVDNYILMLKSSSILNSYSTKRMIKYDDFQNT